MIYSITEFQGKEFIKLKMQFMFLVLVISEYLSFFSLANNYVSRMGTGVALPSDAWGNILPNKAISLRSARPSFLLM